MIKDYAGAKRYAARIQKGKVESPFADKDAAHSLKFLARAKDEGRFRIVVEFMCGAIKTQKDLKLYSKEPLALVEAMCRTLDHGEKDNFAMLQTYRGIKVKRPPTGQTQKFFQKIYGSHFFRKKYL